LQNPIGPANRFQLRKIAAYTFINEDAAIGYYQKKKYFFERKVDDKDAGDVAGIETPDPIMRK
jgi:hypothetical protein